MERIAIIGLGLIGGSLGLALKKAGVVELEVVGFSRSAQTRARAQSRGVIDRAEAELASAVAEASLVVIATPVLAMKEVMEGIAPHLGPTTVVTDTGSTKVQVLEWARQALPTGVSFVGGHPMAGKEVSGLDGAEADLFRGSIYCVVTSSASTLEGVRRVSRLAELVGAEPLLIDAEEHDRLVAGISHLPLLLSAALVDATTSHPSWAQMSKLAAGGYRDVTRLAGGDPVLSRDICLTNQEAILEWMERFSAELATYRRLIAQGSQKMESAFARAHKARQRWREPRK